MNWQSAAREIQPVSRSAQAAAKERQASLTTPPGSLGRLESLSERLAGIQAAARPNCGRKAVLVAAGDHGVVAEGVSAYPQAVTGQMVANFAGGGAAINALARQAGARLWVADVGVAEPVVGEPAVRLRRIKAGTANMAAGAAMSRSDAEAALNIGIELAEEAIGDGLDVLGLGEMGIGNTTAAAAVAAAIVGREGEAVIGPGSGVDEAGLSRKAAAVNRALEVNQPQGGDALDVLAKVGGFELGALAGACLAAARRRVAVVTDGFPATAAAMLAVLAAGRMRDYLIAGHQSMEPGHGLMLDWLGLAPVLQMQMRLGEGTGAALAMPILEAACRTLNEMATFDEAGVVSDKSPSAES
jgi:nicotinate-nucleotide--dimethylbenzimidazole phosphoribosyltransferase